MSSEEAGLLHAVCAEPDDVAPRLVYADWLEERGGAGDPERAEFIRLQCRLAGPEEVAPRERARLAEREKALLQEWGKAWMAPLRGCFARYEFRRGFVERVTVQTKKFVASADAFLLLTPLRVVKLRDPRDHVERLAATPALGRLDGLSLNFGKLGQARLGTFLASPHLGRLRFLDLGNNNLAAGGMTILAKAAPRLESLRHLALDDNNVRDAGVATLAESPLLRRLEVLNLDANELGDGALRSLAGPGSANLVQLHLARNFDLTLAGLRQLLSSPHLAGLRKICLYGSLGVGGERRLRQELGQRLELDFETWITPPL
jgi:uncharacterized protein (TIGR02996 family)